MDEVSQPLPAHLKKVKMMKGARNRALLAPRRTPANPTAIQLPPYRFIPLPSNADFDEYLRGPTVEDVMDYIIRPDNFPTNPYAMPTVRGPWETFKDYGYRLEPSFALMFNNQDPVYVKEHLLPVGKRDPGNAHLENITGDYIITRNGEIATTVSVDDVVSMGMEEMLASAGNPNSETSLKAFVCGRLESGNYIHVNPEHDEIEVDDEDIVTSIDIDSMIWVTHQLVSRQALKVFVLPRIAKKAPIWRHNHVYVDILTPRSDEDKANSGSRSEWLSKSFPLTAIPHTHFAMLGDGAGSIEISVFFPRMIHRDNMTGYRVNIVPMEVQSMWYDEVLLPSIIASTHPGCLEYVNFTLSEWRWKASINQRFEKTKTTPMHASSLDDLQYCMRKIIKANEDELDIFGSFFFVCDFRGAKVLTTSDDPYKSLCTEYPAIDWDYAMDRKNGQLFFDIGISFHVFTTENVPLVGLWRLDAINASYNAAGTNAGIIHYTNTMAAYGGRQAETETTRMRAVQLSFRSTYNLVFESIRKPGTEAYFCEDVDAYDCSSGFLECCDKYKNLFKGARGKSYGVREELRGSGPAMKIVLQNAKERVCLSVHTFFYDQ
jgi:hypothetical protein